MKYQTVFDASAPNASKWLIIMYGVCFVLIGVCIYIVAAALLKNTSIRRAIIIYATTVGGLMAASALLWSFGLFNQFRTEQQIAKYSLDSGQTLVATGVITNFRPEDVNHKIDESFSVQGVNFSYSHFIVNGGFNASSPFGGPVRNGLPVRVFYLGNYILKLQIGKTTHPP